jgi:hypothetical protein
LPSRICRGFAQRLPSSMPAVCWTTQARRGNAPRARPAPDSVRDLTGPTVRGTLRLEVAGVNAGRHNRSPGPGLRRGLYPPSGGRQDANPAGRWPALRLLMRGRARKELRGQPSRGRRFRPEGTGSAAGEIPPGQPSRQKYSAAPGSSIRPTQSGSYWPLCTHRRKLDHGRSLGYGTKPCLTGFSRFPAAEPPFGGTCGPYALAPRGGGISQCGSPAAGRARSW